MRQTSSVLYMAVDSLIPDRGKSIPGLDEFTAALDRAGIPGVWVTNRTRLQMDEPRRKHGHAHPFIAEGGSGIYLPEDYFHLRPEPKTGRSHKDSTVRLGRFTCVPIAESQPAAAEALESLSEDAGVAVVTLKSLTPRELVQNLGLPIRQAELARQRDFDELFFFAGVTETDLQRFQAEASLRKLQLRQRGALWSLAIGPSVQRSIRDLSRLYDRALRAHAAIVGVATLGEAKDLFPFCERAVLVTDSEPEEFPGGPAPGKRTKCVPLLAHDVWEQLLKAVL